MMTELTDTQLREAKIRLAMITEGKRALDAHMAQGSPKPPEDAEEDVQIEALGESMFWYTISKLLRDQVEQLADFLGVHPDAEDKLAEIIELFDGNRRKARLR